MIAALAIKTGIAPVHLLDTPPHVFRAMVEIVWPNARPITGNEAWEALEHLATD